MNHHLPQKQFSQRKKAYLLLTITALIWGAASPVIKHTLTYIQPFSFLFWRFLLSTIILLPVFLFYIHKKKLNFTLNQILKICFIGFIGTTLSLGLLFIGYDHTTAIDGALIHAISPILVVIGGALFLKEKITGQEKIGTFITLFGSIITIIQPFLEGKALAKENIIGNILVFFSAIAWAAYCLLVRKVETKKSGRINPLVLTFFCFLTGLITITPLFLYESWLTQSYLKSFLFGGGSYFFIERLAIPGIFYISIFSSVIAYFTYDWGYSLIEASEATLFDYLNPIFTAPLAVVWLGEKITPAFLLGAGLIFIGIFITESRHKNQK